MITSIINLPAKGHLKGRYVTTGKDGTFRFWQAKVPHCLITAKWETKSYLKQQMSQCLQGSPSCLNLASAKRYAVKPSHATYQTSHV